MAKKQSEFIDIKSVLDDYLRHWLWFVVSIVFFLGIGVLYTRVKKPVYAVRANVLIAQEDSNPLNSMGGGEMATLGSLFGAKGSVDDEFYVLSSHSIYREAVQELKLNRRYFVRKGFLNTVQEFEGYPIEVEVAAGMFDTLKTAITFKIKASPDKKAKVTIIAKKKKIVKNAEVQLPHVFNTAYGNFELRATDAFPTDESVKTSIVLMGYHHAAEDLAKNLSMSIASKRANVISMGINTSYPENGEDILNEVVRQYNDRGIEEKNLQAIKTRDFLNERLALLEGDLNAAESDIQNYKQSQGIVDVEVEAKYQTEKRATIEQSLINGEVQGEVLKMTAEFIKNPKNAYDLIPSPSVENPGLLKAIQSYNEVVLRRMQLAANAKAGNVALRQLTDQIDAMRDNVYASVMRAYDTNAGAVRDLRSKLNSTMGRLGAVPVQEREYIDKERQRKIKQEIYMFLLQRQEETAIMLANSTPKGIVVDEAFTLNEALGLGTKGILIICLLLGLCVPPMALYIRKFIRNRVDTRQEVERLTDVPIVGEISTSRSGKHLVVDAEETSSTAELFRLMRSNLLFMLTPPTEKVVIVTSASPGDGKSFVAVNLAASLALLNKRVILVGMDIRKPRLAEYLNIHAPAGLTQYVANPAISIDSIIVHEPNMPNMDVIVAGPVPPNPGELLTSPRVDELFAQLRRNYDFIIVDTAPVGRVSDTFTLDRISDTAIFVCRMGHTSITDMHLADEIRDNHRLKKLSVAINGTPARRTYGYGEK
ncbi:MAG: polysaccharide biosynthesis tyrosine autokinase [Muribaculaceae bacterium]|nr:polysaccharide biosynthesis tyrosine autokinase [Muribaculaceae bacterium]